MFFDFLNQFSPVSISKLTPFYIILQLIEGNKNAFYVAKHIFNIRWVCENDEGAASLRRHPFLIIYTLSAYSAMSRK
jgi:hypothetical protein